MQLRLKMATRGRGLFQLEEDIKSSLGSSSGSDKTKDSGLGTGSRTSTGERRRLGRGKILDDIPSVCSKLSSISVGRGFLNEPIEVVSTLGSGARSIIAKKIEVPKEETSKSSTTTPPENTSNFFASLKTIHGTKGLPVKVACNYIRINSDPNKGVFVYEVRFSPNIDSTSLRRQYLNEHSDKFGGVRTFDGVTLYLPIKLKDSLTTFISKANDRSNIEIRILFKRRETLKDCIHLYNVLFDRIMKTLNYVRFDRKQFDPTSPKVIPQQKLEVWPGYVTAVDEYEGGLLLCCDVSHRLLCQKTVYETLVEIYKSNPQSVQEMAKKALLGSIVITRYNNKTYRIDDICFDRSPQSTFSVKGFTVNFLDYYRQNYNITIRDKNQPLIICIKKQRKSQSPQTEDLILCLIPELCYLTGLRDEIRSDQRLMREIATFTRVTPNQRVESLKKFYTNISQSPESCKILSDWGLSLVPSYEEISARQFEEEKIYFAQNVVSAGHNADFSKHVATNELLEIFPINNWLLIHCKVDTKVAASFCEHMQRNTRSFGLTVHPARIVVINNDRIDTYVNALRQNITRDTQIVVCICTTSRDDRYAAIKKTCCAEIPIPSQVINSRTLQNETKNRAIVQKIALQMNCKLGGSLWSIRIPFKNVMICGVDVYHDAFQKGNSVAAFVASLNSKYSKWYSKAVIQSKREEILSGLCSCLISALKEYEVENRRFPDNVIIYRDGVGDGQLQVCASYEVPQLEEACRKMLNYIIKITFIVVQKRINTRYFSMNRHGFENPAPGTIVDTTITRARLYDFFLVSQAVKQGSVSPTHYVVLRDDAQYSPDIIQRLSYKLCFLYYNWPGTIRNPACCQYAHKMAYLVGQSIKRPTSEDLSKKLFYL
uniref:Piwi domain-containing protein n=1 Tax=Glossina brevipalpis TaxID=37001 RepID=A0A1A9WEW9_9MUSC